MKKTILSIALLLACAAARAEEVGRGPAFIRYYPPSSGGASFPLLAPTGCDTPPYSFTGETTDGMCHSGSLVRVGENVTLTGAFSVGSFGGGSVSLDSNDGTTSFSALLVDALGGLSLQSTDGTSFATGVIDGATGKIEFEADPGAGNTYKATLGSGSDTLDLITANSTRQAKLQFGVVSTEPGSTMQAVSTSASDSPKLTFTADDGTSTNTVTIDEAKTAFSDPVLMTPSGSRDVCVYCFGGTSVGLYFNGGIAYAAGNIDRDLIRTSSKTLSEGVATAVVRIEGGAQLRAGGTFEYTVQAYDGDDNQARHGSIKFAVTNKAGTETCAITGGAVADETEDGSVLAADSGTLTYNIDCDTTPTNGVDLRISATSSLTQTSLNVSYRVTLDADSSGASASITPQ